MAWSAIGLVSRTTPNLTHPSSTSPMPKLAQTNPTEPNAA